MLFISIFWISWLSFKLFCCLIVWDSVDFGDVACSLHDAVTCLFCLFTVFGSDYLCSAGAHAAADWIDCIDHAIIDVCEDLYSGFCPFFNSLIILMFLHLLTFLTFLKSFSHICGNFSTKPKQITHLFRSES